MKLNYFRTFNLRSQVMLAFLTISFVSSLVYMYYGYRVTRSALIDSIDKQILLSALTIDQLLPAGFIDRCINQEPMSDEEKRAAMIPILRFAKNAAMTYLYVVVKDEASGKYMFVVASGEATEEAPEKGVWVTYNNPWHGIVQTLEDGETRFSEGADDYGYTHSAYLRSFTPSGNPYVLGADLMIEDVKKIKQHAFILFLSISCGSFVATALTGWFLAKQISHPIQKLRDFTIHLRHSNFSPALRLSHAMFDDRATNRNECSLLARDIDQMQSELITHIDELKNVTKEKERAESELRIAGQIQQSLLPGKFKSNLPIDLAARVVPAREAAGDLFDYAVLENNRIFFAVGDVSGKGMPAALFMSSTLTLIRSGLRQNLSLQELMTWTNENLAAANPDCTFVTLWIGLFDVSTGQLTYCNGGHNSPILCRANGEVKYLPTATNPLVGVIPGIKFAAFELTLAPGDSLIAYTDGITEAIALDESFFEEERLLETAIALDKNASAEEMLSSILTTVQTFAAGRAQADDITILVFKR